MTKRSIQRAFRGVIFAFTVLLSIGIVISIADSSDKRVVFTTFKDLLPLVLGVAAAWLGYCVQRRSAYQQQLRILWSKLVDAVQCAKQYTDMASPTEQQFRESLTKLSIAIEEVRGVFCNLRVGDSKKDLYPFEPLKDIFGMVAELKFGTEFHPEKAKNVRGHIDALWKDVRTEILKEFDREEPTFPHSHWVDLEKGRVYDRHGIVKRVS